MAYRYRVLALDHDDTTVRSTPEINWPAFVDTLEHLRPDVKYTYEEFFGLCFEPGFDDLCRKILKLDEDEMKFEVENWRRFQERTVPTACDGIGDVIDGARSRGIILAFGEGGHRARLAREFRHPARPDLRLGRRPVEAQAFSLPSLRHRPSRRLPGL